MSDKKQVLKAEIEHEIRRFLENLMQDLYEDVPSYIINRMTESAVERHDILDINHVDADQVYYAITDILLIAFDGYIKGLG